MAENTACWTTNIGVGQPWRSPVTVFPRGACGTKVLCRIFLGLSQSPSSSTCEHFHYSLHTSALTRLIPLTCTHGYSSSCQIFLSFLLFSCLCVLRIQSILGLFHLLFVIICLCLCMFGFCGMNGRLRKQISLGDNLNLLGNLCGLCMIDQDWFLCVFSINQIKDIILGLCTLAWLLPPLRMGPPHLKHYRPPNLKFNNRLKI